MEGGTGARAGTRARDRARPRPRRAGEGGVTLVELLIAVAIMGIAVVGLVSAMFTIVVVSRSDDEAARAEAELRRFAELVRSAPYVACAEPADYLVDDPQATLAREVVEVRFWDGTFDGDAPNFVARDAETSPCTAPADPDAPAGTELGGDWGLQRVELAVTDDEGNPMIPNLAVTKRSTTEG